jgi:hypothetical protein
MNTSMLSVPLSTHKKLMRSAKLCYHNQSINQSLLKDQDTMKQSVNFSDFIDAFKRYDRYAGYGYEALKVIFNYLEEYEQETGQEVELDVSAICCDYSAEHYTDIASNYSIDLDGLDDDEAKQAVIEYIQENSSYLGEATFGELVYKCF